MNKQRARTPERAKAFAHVRTLAGPSRLRVVADAEGWPVIPGRYGRIEWHDAEDLAVYTDRPRLFQKLRAIPGVKRHQTGDAEMRALFPPEAFEQIAGLIKARRRRSQTSLASLGNLRPRVTSLGINGGQRARPNA